MEIGLSIIVELFVNKEANVIGHKVLLGTFHP